MRIVFLVYNIYGMGGTVRTVVNTVNYLAAKNHDIEIISARKSFEEPTFAIDERVTLTPLLDARRGKVYSPTMPLYQKAFKRILLRLPSLLIDKDEDLYSLFSLFLDFKLLAAIRRIKDGVLITTIPSYNLLAARYGHKNVVKIGQEHKYFEGHSKRIQKKIQRQYGKLDALTCLTDGEMRTYQERLAARPVKLYKLENATELPTQVAPLEAKVVVAAGRFARQKGFDILIQAFAHVIQKHPDWKLKIFGTGDEEDNLRELIFKYEAYNNIFLFPTSKDIVKEMMQSSMYVLSSRYEPFGMVLIEAMSVGVPCISFACSGPREIIHDRNDGVLVEEGNTEALAAAINELIESHHLRKTYGRNAKHNVQRYATQTIGGKWELILNEVTRH